MMGLFVFEHWRWRVTALIYSLVSPRRSVVRVRMPRHRRLDREKGGRNLLMRDLYCLGLLFEELVLSCPLNGF